MKSIFIGIFSLFVFSFLSLNLSAQYGPQFDNRGFEQWIDRVSEPVHWHSGGTATGTFSGFVSSQIETSTQTRPGSSGSKSVRIFPTSVLGITANGNLTNGRMNAGSMSATGSGNYNYTQRSNNTYNTPLSQLPDSLSVWVCFRSASTTDKAQVKAVVHGDADYKFIANGTEEPANMHVATAVSSFTRTSTANGAYTWRRLSIPFNNNAPCTDVRYILFTATTNETPGTGSTSDDLFIDDVLLIYKPTLRLGNLNQTQFKPDESININFTLTGTMSPDNLNNAPNEVIAQLSDANGNFSNPIELGRKTTNESGAIIGTIPSVPNGDHYRVRVVSTNYPMIGDNIQEIRISDTLDINENTFFCSLYPNPFTTTLNVITEDEVKSIRVYDVNGRMLKEQFVSGTQFNLDMSELSIGTYLLQIDHGLWQSHHRMLKVE
ncbi:MAG: T9SS type A sorting domain-containing protein [Bacteroidales bacterium]|nr:T9SS type A sorting domain-containing protein [Bacteroidales bacterium]